MDSPPRNSPKRLKTLASSVKFSGGNTLLHHFVMEHSEANGWGVGNYTFGLPVFAADAPSGAVNALNTDGYSALHLAVLNNDAPALGELLSRLDNADVDALCTNELKFSNTALHMAAWLGRESAVRELLKHGASVDLLNGGGCTALCLAARAAHLDTMELLARGGASVSPPQASIAPLHCAAASGRLAAVEFLVSGGADVDAPNGQGGDTALHGAVQAGSLEIAEFLVGKGADVNAGDGEGFTALHKAATRGSLEVAQFLVSRGADVNARETTGIAPLHEAAVNGNVEMVAFLLDRGADVGADVEGWTSLHLAALRGHVSVIRVLLEKGADEDAKNGDGKTALDLATNPSCIDALRNVARV